MRERKDSTTCRDLDANSLDAYIVSFCVVFEGRLGCPLSSTKVPRRAKKGVLTKSGLWQKGTGKSRAW